MAIGICVVAISLLSGAAVQLADARDYHHCHNLPGRTYCHEAQRLPRNWPPNTDTPARAGASSDRASRSSETAVPGERDEPK